MALQAPASHRNVARTRGAGLLVVLVACDDVKCSAGAVRCTSGGVEQCIDTSIDRCSVGFSSKKTEWRLILDCHGGASCEVLDGGNYACVSADSGARTFAQPMAQDCPIE